MYSIMVLYYVVLDAILSVLGYQRKSMAGREDGLESLVDMVEGKALVSR